jgi:unsaturated chondroitin disaccharide hydrolase
MFKSVNFKPPETDDARANFPVLMDHTMDLELVYEAAALTGNNTWVAKADAHLDKLYANMVRNDGSTIQWGYFYDQTGAFISAETRQGISGSTTWSRGQAWAMYSFTNRAVMSGGEKYLAYAKKVCDYWISHVPSDGVPYWDFNATVNSSTPKDSSAAAVAASALLKLASYYRGTADGEKYRAAAEKIIGSLTSAAYLAEGSSSHGILLHGCKYVAQGITDNSLIYGDYYFLETLNRYATLPL